MGTSRRTTLLGLFRSIGSGNLGVSFLLGVSVGWGRYDGFATILVGLDDDDLSIFVLFLFAALDQAIGNKGEDPQHPEENADTTAEYECNCSSFPRTQSSKSGVKAVHEHLPSMLVTATVMLMVVVVVGMLALFLVMLALVDLGVNNSGRGANEGKDVVLMLGMGNRFRCVNQGETENLAEYIGQFQALVTKTSMARAANIAS